MLRRQTVGRQRPGVLTGAISFVAVESEVWIHRGEINQQAIAINFGDDRSGGDGETERVAMNDRLLSTGEARQGKRVDQEIIRIDREGLDRPLQSHATSPAQPEVVDLEGRDLGKPNAQRNLPDDWGEPLSSGGSKLLGVAHTGQRAEQRPGWGRQNDGGRDKRPGPATSPDLVDAGNSAQAQPG